MLDHLGYQDVMINEMKSFLDIQKYNTFQFTIIHIIIFQPFITHLDKGRYCRVIWAESILKFWKL